MKYVSMCLCVHVFCVSISVWAQLYMAVTSIIVKVWERSCESSFCILFLCVFFTPERVKERERRSSRGWRGIGSAAAFEGHWCRA